MSLTPKNWHSFQHYKDRGPSWIKLHHGLLDDFQFARLPIESRALAPMLWLLASEYEGGQITASNDELAFRLRMDNDQFCEALEHLVEAELFIVSDDAVIPDGTEELTEQVAKHAQPSAQNGSRHIPNETRINVWNRDGGKCRSCGSEEHIEYDHIHPVSKGGASDVDNIQLLCRSCNRKKRTKTAEQVATHAQQVATHAQPSGLGSRSLERETEEEREKRQRKKDTGKSLTLLPDDWLPSQVHFDLSEKLGLPRQQVEDAAAEMRGWSLGNGQKRRNWDWVFKNWLRRHAERGNKNGHGRPGSIQEDRSISRAAGRLAEAAERGEFGFGARPGVVQPAKNTNVVRLLPQGGRDES